MTDESSEKAVKVTAQKRAHPALRTLARACIALARWQRDNDESPAANEPNPKPSSAKQPKEDGDA
jgi:hypothetical protein